MFCHAFCWSSIITTRGRKLTGNQSSRTTVPQMVIQVASLEFFFTRVCIRTCHGQFIQQSAKKRHQYTLKSLFSLVCQDYTLFFDDWSRQEKRVSGPEALLVQNGNFLMLLNLKSPYIDYISFLAKKSKKSNSKMGPKKVLKSPNFLGLLMVPTTAALCMVMAMYMLVVFYFAQVGPLLKNGLRIGKILALRFKWGFVKTAWLGRFEKWDKWYHRSLHTGPLKLTRKFCNFVSVLLGFIVSRLQKKLHTGPKGPGWTWHIDF